MEEVKNEQTELSTEAVKTDEISAVSKEEVSLGKFKDVNSLLNAYNSLQSEFTKRCQRIKELEEVAKGQTEVPESNKTATQNMDSISEENKRRILTDYLKDILGRKTSAVVLDDGGTGVSTPVAKPKSISEAGMLAKEIL